MPTKFDDFLEEAHSDYMDLPEEAIKHRIILRDAMEKHGFTGIDNEWWHFDYKNYEGKPDLDISIDDLWILFRPCKTFDLIEQLFSNINFVGFYVFINLIDSWLEF